MAKKSASFTLPFPTIFPDTPSQCSFRELYLPGGDLFIWYGMLNTLGIFDVATLTDAEKLNYADKRHYFCFGEVGMASSGGKHRGPCRDLVCGADRDLVGISRSLLQTFPQLPY